MLGLKRGHIALDEDYEQWNTCANRIICKLQLILGDKAVDIQHIGSTAIHNVKASPIIDVVVGVQSLNDINDSLQQLQNNNFTLSDKQNSQLTFESRGESDDIITYNVFVVKFESMEWINYVNFRDYLNENTVLAQKYNDLKLSLSNKFEKNADAYKAGKSEFIERVLRKALVWSFLGKNVNVKIDRPLGFVHNNHGREITYKVNYGYIPGIIGGDAEELDAYVLGQDCPIDDFSGKVIAVVHRNDDCEDKLVVASPESKYNEAEIMEQVEFAERYYDSKIQLLEDKNTFVD